MKVFLVVISILAVFVLFLVVANTLKPEESKNGSESKGDGEKSEWRKKIGENVWTVLLAIVGMVIIAFGLYSTKLSTPSLAGVGTWGQEHWFWVLVLGGILYTLIELNKGSLGAAAKTLKVVLAIVVCVLLIVAPIGGKIVESSRQDTDQEQGLKRDGILTMPAHGDSAHISPPTGQAVSFTGDEFTTHCVYTDGRKGVVGDPNNSCGDGPILYVYAHNETGRENTVTYRIHP